MVKGPTLISMCVMDTNQDQRKRERSFQSHSPGLSGENAVKGSVRIETERERDRNLK